MNRLTALDVGFLKAEDADRHVSLAMGGLATIQGPLPDSDTLMSTLTRRILALPPLGQRLRLSPFDLGAPEWVSDPEFDVARHLFRVAVPQPGDDQELFRLVADVMSRRLDRDRPLWEIWIIEGLCDDRWAMLAKVHHCMADGIAATHLLAGLFDDGIGESSRPGMRAVKGGHRVGPRDGVAASSPLGWLGRLWNASTTIATAATRTAVGAADITASLVRSSSSPLNGPIGTRRRYCAARVSLRDVERVCKKFGVTINDVGLAAITESYRNVLIRRGEQPTADSLRTLVPVSVRSADFFDRTDNRLLAMLPCLPVEEENPVQRLRLVHARMGRAKSNGQRQAGSILVSLADNIPFPLTAFGVGLFTRLPQRGVVTLATNVCGPPEPLQMMNCTVLSLLPVPPIAMQLRTGVAMLSYAQDLFFGVLADYDAVADVIELAKGIEVAIARLVAISSRRASPRRNHSVFAIPTSTGRR
ncbi:WS/DGAT/MGAT family O-acyltransferase [Mycobacterium sp.]|uniref:WS/DGAT/MGAT family O-acyltransferase n=1 Tax=Mycobacterium sp. TaxID=1785 RepID=UPI003BA8CA96